MKYRTSLLDILRLAWALWRCPHRRYCRIGQILMGAGGAWDLFYVENQDMLDVIKEIE